MKSVAIVLLLLSASLASGDQIRLDHRVGTTGNFAPLTLTTTPDDVITFNAEGVPIIGPGGGVGGDPVSLDALPDGQEIRGATVASIIIGAGKGAGETTILAPWDVDGAVNGAPRITMTSGNSPTLAITSPTVSWGDGIKQVFNPSATTAGLNVGDLAGDPSALVNGDLWYDSTANELTARINGANVALGAGGIGGSVATDTIWDAAGDLAVGSGANTALKLAMGSPLQTLRVNAGGTNLEWAAPAGGGDATLAGTNTFTGVNTFTNAAGVGLAAAAPFYWLTRSKMISPADGTITLLNNAGTAFTLLQLGGQTSAFPAFKRNGAAINARLADDSANANFTVANLTSVAGTFSGAITATDITGTGSVTAGAAQNFIWAGRARMQSPSDGVITMSNAAGTDFSRLQFGGTTSAFPSTKRSGAGLVFRLADDSADAAITAASATVATEAYDTTAWNGNNTVPTKDAVRDKVEALDKTGIIGFTASDATAVATGKAKGFVVCPYAATIAGWSIVVDAGTATVKCWKIASGTAKPTSANSINTAGVAIASGTAIISTTLTDFTTTAVAANDIFAFEVLTPSGVTEITFQLKLTKS